MVAGCYVNGTENYRAELSAQAPHNPSGSQPIDLAAGAVVELYLYQASGTTYNTLPAFPPRLTVAELP